MRCLLALALLVGCGGSTPPTPAAPLADGREPPIKTGACVGLGEAACEASDACHAEFDVPKRFLWCQPGKVVSCTKPDAACDEPDPRCETLGDFEVQWRGGCHQYCVHASSCQP